MVKKILLVIVSILFALSLICFGLGFYLHHFMSDKPIISPKPPVEGVTYKYFLEDIEQTEIPKNDVLLDEEGNPVLDENGNLSVDNKYVFSKYSCTKNLTGSFDPVKWEFTPDKKQTSTCSLYFVKTKYDVSIEVTNGSPDESNIYVIDREKDGVFKITPNEGYVFKEYTCSNNKHASWDKSSNTFTISSIMSDVACTLNFEIETLKMDVTVKYGKGNTTETADFGSRIEAIIEPNVGYEKPTIKCTNGQVATYVDNKIVIEKITKNTACTVTFKKVPTKMYKLIIGDMEAGITVIDGGRERTVLEGHDGKFTLKAQDGYVPSLSCGGINPIVSDENPDGSYTYTFMSMNSNITCNVTSVLK